MLYNKYTRFLHNVIRKVLLRKSITFGAICTQRTHARTHAHAHTRTHTQRERETERERKRERREREREGEEREREGERERERTYSCLRNSENPRLFTFHFIFVFNNLTNEYYLFRIT